MPPSSPRFAGVTWLPGGPQVWKAGATHPDKLAVELRAPGNDKASSETETVRMIADSHYWQTVGHPKVLQSLKDDHFYYRFKDEEGKHQYDFTETVMLPNAKGENEPWNVARRPTGPQQTGSLVYAYLDSHQTPESAASKGLTHATDPLATHAAIDVNGQLGGTAKGVLALLNTLNDDKLRAIGGVVLTPHTGDWTTPHRYQTADPFVLNDAFGTDPATGYSDFDTLIQTGIRKGIKVYADGAFVNAGFASPLYQSLLLHGPRSPYWRWFLFEENQLESNSGLLPDIAANGKMVLGTLPVKDNGHGGLEIDWPHVGLRLENAPHQPDYRPGQPTVLVQFDPNPPKGEWQSPEKASRVYRWPLRPEAVKDVLANSGLPKDFTEATGPKASALLEWPMFRLGRPDEDNSGYKWDGKVPAIRMDLRNPEALAYAQRALTYWTQRTRAVALDTVAHLLAEQTHKAIPTDDAGWQAVVNQLYDAKALPKPLNPLAVAPVKSLPEGETATGKELLDSLWANAPLLSVPLPPQGLNIKATLAWPAFTQEVLNNAGPWRPLAKTINSVLAEQLQALVATLPPAMQQVVAIPAGRDILMRAIGPAVVRLLLTNQQSDDPTAMMAGLHRLFPPEALLADPKLSARAMQPILLRQAKHLPVLNLKPLAEKALAGLTPQTVAVAEQLVNHHELGLNWRLDAAKDVANVDAARNEPTPELGHARFEKEMAQATAMWQQMLSGARRVFPKMAVIAELTRIPDLSGNAVRTVFNRFFTPQAGHATAVFTSMPSVDTFYSSLLRLVHHDPKPYEFGDTQMAVQATGDAAHVQKNSFWDSVVKPFVTDFPKSTTTFAQTLTASHDYANTLYNLLRNPIIQGMDYASYRGLEDDARDVITALASRADAAPLRALLEKAGVADPEAALLELKDVVEAVTPGDLPPLLQPLVTKDDKSKLNKAHGLSHSPVNSREARLAFANVVLETVKTTDTLDETFKNALTDPRHGPAIRAALLQAFATPGEVWATRALLTNGFEALKLDKKPDAKAFYAAMNDVQAKHSGQDARLPGYLSLAKWVDELGNCLWPKAPHGDESRRFKQALFQQILTPALAKDRRVTALMVALPGQPTWYDFFRTGGEQLNNRYLQNRELVRLDWLTNKDMSFIQQEMGEMRALLALRQQYPVLNHGELQNIRQDADKGVLIAAWDGGPANTNSDKSDKTAGQQAIMLVNTGKPRRLQGDEYDQALGFEGKATYPEIPLQQSVIDHYEPNIADLNQLEGTRYKDAATDDVYTVQADGTLKLTHKQGQAAEKTGDTTESETNTPASPKAPLETYRLLIRQSA